MSIINRPHGRDTPGLIRMNFLAPLVLFFSSLALCTASLFDSDFSCPDLSAEHSMNEYNSLLSEMRDNTVSISTCLVEHVIRPTSLEEYRDCISRLDLSEKLKSHFSAVTPSRNTLESFETAIISLCNEFRTETGLPSISRNSQNGNKELVFSTGTMFVIALSVWFFSFVFCLIFIAAICFYCQMRLEAKRGKSTDPIPQQPYPHYQSSQNEGIQSYYQEAGLNQPSYDPKDPSSYTSVKY